jgi:hypothetical protein
MITGNRMRRLPSFATLSATALLACENPASIRTDQIAECLKSPIPVSVEVDSPANPYYLRGDFDGGGKMDYAIAIRARNTKRNGVMVCAGNRKLFLLGAVGEGVGGPQR